MTGQIGLCHLSQLKETCLLFDKVIWVQYDRPRGLEVWPNPDSHSFISEMAHFNEMHILGGLSFPREKFALNSIYGLLPSDLGNAENVVPVYEARQFLQESDKNFAGHIGMVAAAAVIPVIEGSRCSWRQIAEFRRDKEATEKYRDFRLWIDKGLGAQSVTHAVDLISQKIDDYNWAIQKHGIETKLGLLEYLLDWKSILAITASTTAAVSLDSPVAASLVAGLQLAGKCFVWMRKANLNLDDIKRGTGREVAILIDIQKRVRS